MLGWIGSYLSDRTQYVKVLGRSSREFLVKSGVPQGSHLGPLLFLLFFDDITKVIKSSMKLMYADDLKIFKAVRSVLDCSALQRDLDAISEWCQRNCLSLSIGKCKIMSFHRNHSPIHYNYEVGDDAVTRVFEIKDLGVIFDVKLDFNRHIEYVTSKAYSMLGFMKRICNEFRNVKALKSIYCAHVRSHLEYASCVWQPYCADKKRDIESIQKKFVIYALRRSVMRDAEFRLPSYVSRCDTIGIETLCRRRINLSVFFVFDLLRGRIDSPSLRSELVVNEHACLQVVIHRTDYGYYEPVNNLCRIFNPFSRLFVAAASRDIFRARVRSAVLPADHGL
jgi:ribonucleases P/MRP protein subunit RPP40